MNTTTSRVKRFAQKTTEQATMAISQVATIFCLGENRVRSSSVKTDRIKYESFVKHENSATPYKLQKP